MTKNNKNCFFDICICSKINKQIVKILFWFQRKIQQIHQQDSHLRIKQKSKYFKQ